MPDCQHIVGLLDGRVYATGPMLLAVAAMCQGELSDALERFDHCPRCGAEAWLYVPMPVLPVYLQAPRAGDQQGYQL